MNELASNWDLWETLPMEMRPKVRYWVPAAAMDEDDLKAEIHKLWERGFGGVEVVVLDTLPPELSAGEDAWGTDHWNHMLDVIARETKALSMTMDIANGPAWPISMPAVTAQDSAALCELAWGSYIADPAVHGPQPVSYTHLPQSPDTAITPISRPYLKKPME